MTSPEAPPEVRRSLSTSLDDQRRIGRGLVILRRLGVVVTQRIDRTVGPAVAQNSAVGILMTLRAGGPQRPVQLAAATGLTTGGLSKAIDRLEHQGLITRSARGAEADGRAVVVVLTEKGERTANALDDVAAAGLREHSDELDELMAIAAHLGVPVAPVHPNGSSGALARLARLGVVLSEAMRRSPVDDHTSILVLCVLDGEGTCRPSRLIERLGMTSGGVTKLVDRLAARGLVERSYGTLISDRRGVTISITPAGRAELATVLSLVGEHLREVGLVAADLSVGRPA